MWMNCVSIPPNRTLSPGSTSRASHSPGLCSFSLARISASESGVPITGIFGNSRSRYGIPPMWSSCPCVTSSARNLSCRSRR